VHVVVSEPSKPQLVYVAAHCDAPINMLRTSTLLSCLSVQPVMLPLNAIAPKNISSMLVTCPTFQLGISWLNLSACLNMFFMLVT